MHKPQVRGTRALRTKVTLKPWEVVCLKMGAKCN